MQKGPWSFCNRYQSAPAGVGDTAGGRRREGARRVSTRGAPTGPPGAAGVRGPAGKAAGDPPRQRAGGGGCLSTARRRQLSNYRAVRTGECSWSCREGEERLADGNRVGETLGCDGGHGEWRWLLAARFCVVLRRRHDGIRKARTTRFRGCCCGEFVPARCRCMCGAFGAHAGTARGAACWPASRGASLGMV
jgi:hypothetical protein